MPAEGWTTERLVDISILIKDGTHGSHPRVNLGVPLLSARNITDSGEIVWNDEDPRISESEYAAIHRAYELQPSDLLITVVGSLGRRALVLPGPRFSIQRSVALVRADARKVVPDYLYHFVGNEYFQRQLVLRSNATAQAGVYLGELANIRIAVPPLSEQRHIAEILDTADLAIGQTEILISKLKQMKTGLMHDLLTRGLDERGQLRDPDAHPEQFKDSVLGQIPREWEIRSLDQLIESAVDGPFGSNLKTEHYVGQPGVRVVRLQNIGTGYFNDADKAWISEDHAETLRRHEIVPGDLLVASLGDDNHPIARACIYPNDFQAGIVKADCFRLRLVKSLAIHRYIMYVLDCPSTRGDINLLGQGVTRDRVNLSTVRQVRIRVPAVSEQHRIAEILDANDARIRAEEAYRDKLKLQKKGLMEDLLTGKVRVDG